MNEQHFETEGWSEQTQHMGKEKIYMMAFYIIYLIILLMLLSPCESTAVGK